MKPRNPCPNRKTIPCSGLKAKKMRGASPMCEMPSAAIVVKNTSMTGPKKVATRAVPVRCTKNSVTRIRIVSFST